MDNGTTAAVVGTGTAVIVALIPVIKLLRRLSRQMGQLQEDWYGQPARKGFAAIPGVPERLETIEKQLKPNGGSSARDAINRVELMQNRQAIDLGILARKLDDHLRDVGPAISELIEMRRELTELQQSQSALSPSGEDGPRAEGQRR